MNWFKLGDFEIGRIIETEEPFMRPDEMFEQATPERIAPYLDDLGANGICPETGKLIMPIQSYVIRSSKHTVLIDSCVGNDKAHKWFPAWHRRTDDTYLRNMSALGITPADIDIVLCTHLHVDHSGWNTRMENGQWIPTFPNARYVLSKTECDHAALLAEKGHDTAFTENVLPIIDAKQAELVEMDYQIDDQLWLEPTPGHTPGHVAVRLKSKRRAGVVTGDLIHSPLQCRHPEWGFKYDFDHEQALSTRRRFLETYSDSGVAVLSSHFPSPSTGSLRASGDAFVFEYDSF